ncbi:MAG: patatin-like phospholipase family protein [Cyclobacteriaceae bacterium]|nr:patatin-like phospholipase family protein [Cyclobacteriaceae bacterium]
MLADKPKGADGTNRSLILAGGGMRLAYQAGVLIALEEEGHSFSHIDGTSGGIFNAAMLASGLSANEIAEKWRYLKIKHFMSLRPLGSYLKPLNMTGFGDADGIRDHIFPGLGIDIAKIRASNSADFTFNVCNFSDKTVEAITQNEVTTEHLLAGVSLPMVMPGLEIKGKWFSDAVWIKDANLMEAVRRGAEELWLVWAIGNTKTYLPGALNQYVHMIEMSANGGLIEEYERIKLINERIADGITGYRQKVPAKLFVIKPTFPLPLDPDLYFGKIDARSLINMGYVHAKNALNSMPADGFAMDKSATKMADPGIRMSMRAEFSGYMSENNKQLATRFYAYFVLSHHYRFDILDVYASIKIDSFGREIPCFNSHVKASETHGYRSITYTAQFIESGETYSIEAMFRLASAADFLLGLAFKTVRLTITNDRDSILIKGRLYQSINNRLKSMFSTNVWGSDGTSGGLKLRYRMTSKLVNYEV